MSLILNGLEAAAGGESFPWPSAPGVEFRKGSGRLSVGAGNVKRMPAVPVVGIGNVPLRLAHHQSLKREASSGSASQE